MCIIHSVSGGLHARTQRSGGPSVETSLTGAGPRDTFRPDPSLADADAPWKREVADFTAQNLKHSAWGFAHAERDYLLAVELAEKGGLQVDKDVLYAAAYLHDMGGFEPYKKDGVDHADRSAEVCDSVLIPAGFPPEKLEAVRAAMKTHSYYDDRIPATNEAKVLHDADSIDFLGAIGITRILSLTGREPFLPDISASLKLLDQLRKAAPKHIYSGPYAENIAKERAAEMDAFLGQLDQESHQRKHL